MHCLKSFEGFDQFLRCGQKPVLQTQHRRDVQGGGEGIVGGLAHIHVVVRMAKALTRELVCAVCDDLVCVHIGLGAGAGLPHHQWKMLVQRAACDLGGSLFDDGAFGVSHLLGPERVICPRRRLLKDAEGAGDFPRHGLDPHADGEVFTAALGLRAPVFPGGHFDLAHGIMFDPVFH